MLPHIGWPEMLLIGGIALLLFGARKLPDAARSIGKSLNAFKQGLKEGAEEDKESKEEEKKPGGKEQK